MRYGMMIELEKCIGCFACVSACKEQWDSGPQAERNWVYTYEHGRRDRDLGISFYPGLCMHCKQHPCTVDCPSGATYRDENGVVVVDPNICIGCGNCLSNCAYGARKYDPIKKIVEKCNFCSPLVARGEAPACVQTCLAQCRHFGDLDDKGGPFVNLIKKSKAQVLETKEVSLGPKVFYAGLRQREEILAREVVRPPQMSWLTRVWHDFSLPLTRGLVPAFGFFVVLGGVLINFRSRGGAAHEPLAVTEDKDSQNREGPRQSEKLIRHKGGMRFLHWFNLLSWVVLLFTGMAIMSTERFKIIGGGFSGWMADFFGGAPELLRFHVSWGLFWSIVIVPLFLLFKKGGKEALQEVLLTSDDIKWLRQKPLDLLGFSKEPLPDQDKYNAGQKLYAIFVLLGTGLIILTGVIMTFHLGSPAIVAVCILLHKLAIAFVLLGLSVHFTMAVIMREERHALKSMIDGNVSRALVENHNIKWVNEYDNHPGKEEI